MPPASGTVRRTGWAAFLAAAGMCWLSACFVIPPPVPSNYNRGVEAYDAGRWSDAVRYYKRELEQHPDNHFARYNLAVAYQDQKKIPQAEAEYQTILAQREHTESRINLAAIHFARGDAEAGFRQLREAAGKNPDDPNPLSMWGHYLEAAGRLEEARQRYQEALQIDGQHAPSHFRLGRLYLKMGMQPRAEAALKKAVELDPKAPEYLETLASYFLEQQRPMEAIDMLERVSVLQPDRMDLYVRLGNLYQKQGHHREAADRYWEAASIEPGNSEVHRHLRDLFQVLVEEEKKKLEQLRKNRAVAQSQPGR